LTKLKNWVVGKSKFGSYHDDMCSHYQAIKERERYVKHFGVEPPIDMGKHDVWPGYPATFIRRPRQADVGDEAVPEREALPGLFGLIPHWATDVNIGRQTYNARTETVAAKPSFRDAWKNSQHCIIPVDAIFEPDWRSGKAIATRLASVNGEPFGIAGLWSSWKSPKGVIHSFTMLTINAAGHDLMCQFHKPVDEKRMVVILPPDSYDHWLKAKQQESMDFMRQFPADRLIANAELPAQRSLLG
jgi:putative SOS response-associated peptidase YedK